MGNNKNKMCMTLGQAMTPNQNALEDSISYSHSFHKLIVKSLSYDETHQTPMNEIQIAIIAPWCPIPVNNSWGRWILPKNMSLTKFFFPGQLHIF